MCLIKTIHVSGEKTALKKAIKIAKIDLLVVKKFVWDNDSARLKGFYRSNYFWPKRGTAIAKMSFIIKKAMYSSASRIRIDKGLHAYINILRKEMDYHDLRWKYMVIPKGSQYVTDDNNWEVVATKMRLAKPGEEKTIKPFKI